MPSFVHCMNASVDEFGDYAGSVGRAQNEFGDFDSDRKDIVDGLRPDWKGDDYDALRDDSDELSRHCTGIGLKMDAAALAARTGGTSMTAQTQALKAVDRAAKSIGFLVQPPPMVMIGPRIQAQIAAAGPGAPAMQAAYQAAAVSFTMALRGMTTAITTLDIVTGTGLQQIANTMRPLTSMSSLTLPNSTPLQTTPESLDRAAALREELEAEHARFMRERSHKQRGPVLGAVMDPNGEVFYGNNPDAKRLAETEGYHPMLQDRIDALKQNRTNYDGTGVVNHGEPGEHAEILALNKALMKMDPTGQRRDIDLGGFMVDNFRSSKGQSGFVRCCSNCMQVLQGVEGSGRGW